jgi:hypothetical protein
MLRILDRGPRLCDGLSRRDWLRIGGLALGGLTQATLATNRQAQAAAGTARVGKAKSVIVLQLLGGAPQHDTWDPKPEAPAEVRGEFGVIASKTPGLMVGELMPQVAKLTDKIAVLRAMVTGDNAHSSSGYYMLTGVPHQPMNQESATPKAPNNWPCMGSIVRYLKHGQEQLPAAVTLPEHIWNTGNFPWPGQDAGFMGLKYDPWLIHCDPSEEKFTAPSLTLPEEITALRFDGRRKLREQLDQHLASAEQGSAAGYSLHAQKAVNLLGSPAAREAFDLQREPASVRDRYGRSRFAQSCLLARRLIESGVSLVQVNWTRIKDQANDGGWDTHAKHCEMLKKLLMPIMDQAYSALLEDLAQRGLLDETLVVWMGEFGHTPKINRNAGRDHWGHVFSVALAGGGIRGGQVIGSSDAHAGYPVSGVTTPPDFLATIFHCLGYQPETEMRDPFGRPLPISRGRVIEAIV